ncbi:hypothetical protein GCM10025861_27780 (plasmid) [Methanobacterium petrolearium]|nr:hypothetical protein GCM10025861_27780 [Methanobacterium petrolearium]
MLQNILFSIATISAGYHVIILEGLGETIENSKVQKKFTPNSHILMGLAAIGASLMGNFWEGTLLILIFQAHISWKIMQKEEVNEKSRNYSK